MTGMQSRFWQQSKLVSERERDEREGEIDSVHGREREEEQFVSQGDRGGGESLHRTE